MHAQKVVRQVRAQIGALGPAAERTPEEHARLRARLDEVPPKRRNRSWHEASVLVDVAFRQRPRRAFSRLGRFRKHQDADFAAFWAECVRVMAPYTLGPHGYKVALGGRDQQALWTEVDAVVSAVADFGYECFVNSGTLLGLIRDGAVVAHDDDVDLAVVLHSSTTAEAAAEWLELRARLSAAGLLVPGFEARRRGHSKVTLPSGTNLDLFPAWVTEGRMWVWPHTAGNVPADDVLPLVPHAVGDAQMLLPRRPRRLLRSNYGPDWRTPDPTWRFAWPRARRQFTEFVEAIGMPRGNYAAD